MAATYILIASCIITSDAYAASVTSCPYYAQIFDDGSVRFGDKHYNDMAQLKSVLIDFQKHNPNCMLAIAMPDSGADDKIDYAMRTIQSVPFSLFVFEPAKGAAKGGSHP